MAESTGIVIVHYRREAELERLLGDLIARHGIPPNDIVVVDNGGDDDVLVGLRGRYPVRWVVLDNPGYGAAVNAGVQELNGSEYVLVLTHEVLLEAGAIEGLRSAVSSDPTVGIAGPLLLNGDDGAVWSAGGLTSRVRRLPRHRGAGALAAPEGMLDAEWLDGACFLMRRSELVACGGLDEKFFLYFEDVDLGWRVRDSGRRVVTVCASRAWQTPGGHLDQFYATRNLLLLFRKHRRRIAFGLYVGETLGRLALGWVVKPRGSGGRRAKRWAGLRAGLAP